MTVPVARFEPEDDLLRTLRALSDVLLRYPIAVQAAFSALAAEGRRFAATPEGQALKTDLAASELFDRVRLLWGSLGMHAFVERPIEVLPSFFLDGAMRAAAVEKLEPILSALLDDLET